MFERDAYVTNLVSEEALEPLLKKFCNNQVLFASRSHMNWSEHCSECVMPDCFTSCGFYTPRNDMKCNRFEGGIKIARDDSTGIILDITFKNWGKFEAAGASKMMGSFFGYMYECIDRLISPTVTKLPISHSLESKFHQKLYGAKNKISSNIGSNHVYTADAFFLEIGNPNEQAISIVLTFRNRDNADAFFQQQINLVPGYQSFEIEVEKISHQVNLNKPYLVSIEPLGDHEQARLLIGVLDFVKFRRKEHIKNSKIRAATTTENTGSKKAKCVIWDLDNTLWKGVMVEDGPENLEANQAAIDLIYEFDKKGILNSIASKNNPEEVLTFLEKLGLKEMFLYPQISWDPKSQSIANIQQALNIGMDTLIFIDDQIFEREEVTSQHPQIRAFDIADIDKWKLDQAFDIEISSESSKRREMYRDQIVRETHFKKQDNLDYEAFLRDCKICVTLENLSKETAKRAFELAQRTNQMNFSGTRYSMNQIQSFLASNDKEATIVRCKDRFGDYGIVGLAVFDKTETLIEDLMFSCRIQSKYVDRSVLEDFAIRIGMDLRISFKPTQKNMKSAQIFKDLGFEVEKEEDGQQILRLQPNTKLQKNNIVELSHVTA